MRRSSRLRVLPGWHSVPGGGVDPGDAGLAEWLCEQGEPGSSAEQICALREAFEETGILPLAGRTQPPAELAADRASLLAKRTTFGALLTEWRDHHDLLPAVSRLLPVGNWTTPTHQPVRFSSDFFALEWPADEAIQPAIDGHELVHGEWIAPTAALGRWRAGEVLLAQPTLHLLRTLDEHGPHNFAPPFADPAAAHLGPLRRMEVTPGMWVFPLRSATLPPATHTNVFVGGGPGLAIIDPGAEDPQELEAFVAALQTLQAETGGQLAAIYLTHHHPDHVAGAGRLAKRFGLAVHAHPATARLLEGAPYKVRPSLIDGAGLAHDGGPWRVMHTPGHAPGHICFFNPATRALLGGDMTSGVSSIILNPPEGDLAGYLASLDRLIALGPRTLFPAHGPPAIPAVAALEQARDHRLQRNQQILTAWAQGHRDAAALRPSIYPALDPRAHALAERQIESHLIYLAKQGQIER